MHFWKLILRNGCLLFFSSLALFLFKIELPPRFSYDEAHYVPAAKEIIALKDYRNLEHPPLGKLLIATGIQCFGDCPLGWRFMSTVFGALTLVGMYILAVSVFGTGSISLWVAWMTLFNHLLYVQARTALLDTFMVAFLVWGLAFFSFAFHAKDPWKDRGRGPGREPTTQGNRFGLLALSGLFLGLSLACKWFAIVPILTCLGLAAFDHCHPSKLRATASWSDLLVCLGLIPLLTYALSFLPLLIRSHQPQFWLTDFVILQWNSWKLQQQVTAPHTYMSHWIGWPIMLRPIWYAFQTLGLSPNKVSAVFLIGNPLILWTGIPAIIFCLGSFFIEPKPRQNRQGLFIFTLYCCLYLSWAVLPRKVLYFYYYYPAAMILSLALGFFFVQIEKIGFSPRWKWGFAIASGLLFFYYLPVLSGMPIDMTNPQAIRRWAWFQSWI
jgi:dolichyl-phosphate-mannose--protein O-mannosyl transferase